MTKLWISTALAAALAAGGCTSMPAPAPAPAPLIAPAPAPAPAPAAAQADAGERLEALFKESDEANLRRNPIEALLRGDLRYATEFGDYVTPAYFEAERAAAARDLEQLRAINRSALNPTQQIAYDVFRWQAEQSLKSNSPDIL